MRSRPKWVRAIHDFVTDEVIDAKYEFPSDGSDDDVHDRVEFAVVAVFCAHYGHQIEDDQCGIPEHRYCIWCRRTIGDIESDDE